MPLGRQLQLKCNKMLEEMPQEVPENLQPIKALQIMLQETMFLMLNTKK